MTNIISGVNIKNSKDALYLHFLTILLIDIYFFIQIIYIISSTMVTLHPLDNNMKNKKYYTVGKRTLL